MRLGVALREQTWAWALVELDRGGARVRRGGEITAGDLATLRAALDGIAVRVALALPDRDCHVRRIRVGHPPQERDGLRRLARWRLREELPAGDVAVDAKLDGENALVLAATSAKVADAERALAGIGAVEVVTAGSLAVLEAVPAAAVRRIRIVDDLGYAEVEREDGRLEAIALRDGEPGAAESGTRVIDCRKGTAPPALDDEMWKPIEQSLRARLLPAVGAALAGEDVLNVATRPPVPARARRAATVGVGVAAALALTSVAMLASADHGARGARAALDAVPVPISSSSPSAEDQAIDALAARQPRFTASLAELERTLPGSATLERLEWKDGVLTIRVTVPDASALDATEKALASSWSPISQSFRTDGIVADFRRSGS